MTAHRRVLQLTTGKHGLGLEAAHAPSVCHDRACVNPRHLRWATPTENHADKLIDGTDNRGERSGSAKLTETQVLAIRSDQRLHREIATDYGVSRAAVSLIKSRKNWGWLQPMEDQC